MEAHPGAVYAHPGVMEVHHGAMETHLGFLYICRFTLEPTRLAVGLLRITLEPWGLFLESLGDVKTHLRAV
jgi:hypothetical protein